MLRDAGSLGFGAGEPISLMEVVPLSADELATCRQVGSQAFCAGLGPLAASSRAPRWVMRQT